MTDIITRLYTQARRDSDGTHDDTVSRFRTMLTATCDICDTVTNLVEPPAPYDSGYERLCGDCLAELEAAQTYTPKVGDWVVVAGERLGEIVGTCGDRYRVELIADGAGWKTITAITRDLRYVGAQMPERPYDPQYVG